ncbi:MAG: hypothetical protein WCH98_07015 [Verrucomicrobiota bacterium]
MIHSLNFTAGWWLILAAFATGAGIGMGFHREDFLGGYGSFRRRLARLGHIALAALGGLNVLYGLSPVPASAVPGWLLLAGGIAMPVVCFLSAWKPIFRHLFFIPVVLLVSGVGLIIYLTRGSGALLQ